MPLSVFYTMVQKSQKWPKLSSQKWPKTQIKGGGVLPKYMDCRQVVPRSAHKLKVARFLIFLNLEHNAPLAIR